MNVCTLIKKSVCTFCLVFVGSLLALFNCVLCRQVIHLYSFLIPTSVGGEGSLGQDGFSSVTRLVHPSPASLRWAVNHRRRRSTSVVTSAAATETQHRSLNKRSGPCVSKRSRSSSVFPPVGPEMDRCPADKLSS